MGPDNHSSNSLGNTSRSEHSFFFFFIDKLLFFIFTADFFFNWSITALRCCVNFCCTTI